MPLSDRPRLLQMTISHDTKRSSAEAVTSSEALERQPVFFPALSSLRFFAALAVFVWHAELYRQRCGLPSHTDNYTIWQFGVQGVNLFFVLSSFLLTYLLLCESKQTGGVSIRQFYARRALRVWPLYFLIVALAFGLVPLLAPIILSSPSLQYLNQSKSSLPNSLLLFMLMMPNLSLLVNPRVIGASQCWSLGVEEQFYLFWPIVLKLFRRRLPLIAVAFFGAILTMIKVGQVLPANLLYLFPHLTTEQLKQSMIAGKFLVDLGGNLQMMLLGAIAALIYFAKKQEVEKYCYRSDIRGLLALGLIVCLTVPIKYCTLAFGVVFALVVLSLTDQRLKALGVKPLVYLGTISYGIYMFHPLVLECYMKLAAVIPSGLFDVLLCSTALPVVLIVSAASYQFFELPFLKLKNRLALVRSGPPTM